MASPQKDYVLEAFTQDTYRLLESDETPAGKMLCGHIGRQLDLLATDRHRRWFAETGERAGFYLGIARAAIAASDVTKVAHASVVARTHFGTTQERVEALARGGDLRFGRVFDTFTPLENLYLHAEAGRHYAQTELARRGTNKLGELVGEAVLGHDSFNSGFGRYKLKVFLGGKYRENPHVFQYPISCSPAGFVVQVLDRLEGCDPRTMVRYVTEGVTLRNERLGQAIRVGLIENYVYLLEAYDQIVLDAQSMLTAEQVRVFHDSEALGDFRSGLERIPAILARLCEYQTQTGEECFRLEWEGKWVELDSLEVFRDLFLRAVGCEANLG